TETFDPKPDAPREIRGALGTIPSSVPGVRVGELFPRTAAVLNRVTLLRARLADHTEHLAAMQGMLRRGRDGRHLLTRHAARAGGAPSPYAETRGVISSSPSRADPFSAPRLTREVQWDEQRRRFLPPAFGGAAPRLHGRMELLRRLDTFPDND